MGPLQNNGGRTQTHALLAGSPAADAGDPNFDTSNLPFDQRGAGFPRVKGPRIDIGAFESEASQSGSNIIVNNLDDHDDGICGVSDCTLREAVNYAPAGATITFSVTGTITLTRGEILVDRNMSFSGPMNSQGITVSVNNMNTNPQSTLSANSQELSSREESAVKSKCMADSSVSPSKDRAPLEREELQAEIHPKVKGHTFPFECSLLSLLSFAAMISICTL